MKGSKRSTVENVRSKYDQVFGNTAAALTISKSKVKNRFVPFYLDTRQRRPRSWVIDHSDVAEMGPWWTANRTPRRYQAG